MAVTTILGLLGAIVAALGYYLADPTNMARFKTLVEPALIALPLGYHGNQIGDLLRHADLMQGGDIGTEGCAVVHGFDACEDGEIHYPSHTAFLACSTIQSREHWFPPQGAWNRTAHREQDYVIKYDLKTDKIVKLKTPNYKDDIVTHGMGLFVPSPESEVIYIHLVNHKKHPQSCVSIFSHKIGTDTMEHLEDNCDRLIVDPNDVAPVGPRSFYLTNMHAYNPHGKPGLEMIKRRIEDGLGSWEWTNLVYCGEGEYFGKCKEVATGLVGGNGVLVVKDLVYVDNSGGGFINVYKINADHSVTQTEKIMLGSACDNLSYDPVADALLVATFPALPELMAHLHNARNIKKAPLAIDKIKRLPDPAPGKTKHEVGIVLFAKDLTGGISIGLSDSEVNKSILGGIIQEGIVVCRDRALASEDIKVPA